MGSLRLYRDIPAKSLVPSYPLHNSPMCGHVTISLPQHAHAQKKDDMVNPSSIVTFSGLILYHLNGTIWYLLQHVCSKTKPFVGHDAPVSHIVFFSECEHEQNLLFSPI